MAGGRPTRYRKEFAEQARKLCFLGFTDVQLADFFEVTEKTINNWKQRHPEFLQSLKSGKAIADGDVVESLFQRACGYEHEEDKIFQYEGRPVIVPTVKKYAPDPVSMIFWLKNRQPELWRDKVEEKPPATQSSIMPIPTCDNVDDWEEVAQSHQAQIINA